jgi:hypothetical protein
MTHYGHTPLDKQRTEYIKQMFQAEFEAELAKRHSSDNFFGGPPSAQAEEDAANAVVIANLGNMSHLHDVQRGIGVDTSRLHPAYASELARLGTTTADIQEIATRIYSDLPPAQALKKYMARAEKVRVADIKSGYQVTESSD